MDLSAEELRQAESGILSILRGSPSPFSPADLMTELGRAGVSEYAARVALWYLIDRNLVELTMDRLLRARRRGSESADRRVAVAAGG